MEQNLKNEYNNYIDSLLDVFMVSRDIYDMSEDEVRESPFFHMYIEEDLKDHGFDDTEIYAIRKGKFNKTLAYKMLAYIYSMYGQYNNIDDLKSIIIGSFYSDIEDFSEEDLINIYNQGFKIEIR